ncbi:putative peptidase [Naematelia encephala]|uniref:Mitochondrial inner membrane protease subunit 2 n=1 Tax=Naematelia encephala TaxID=71784 RepID=A0A1Y2AR09_9TREE|nr:putative peptidase [Naematelia encephala]
MASRGFFRTTRAFFSGGPGQDALRVLSWVPVGLFFTQHVYSLVEVTGSSMQPTLNPNFHTALMRKEIVLLERWSVTLNLNGHKPFRRGDVVTLWSPLDPNTLTTKRIVALAGDIVTPLPPSPPTPVRIPPGHCWVEGDSRHRTLDSNTYGPVSMGLVNARVAWILLPFSRWGPVENGPGKAEGRVEVNERSRLIDAS